MRKVEDFIDHVGECFFIAYKKHGANTIGKKQGSIELSTLKRISIDGVKTTLYFDRNGCSDIAIDDSAFCITKDIDEATFFLNWKTKPEDYETFEINPGLI